MEIPTFVEDNFQFDYKNTKAGGEAIIFIGSHSNHGEIAVKKWHEQYYGAEREIVLKREIKILMENPHPQVIEVIGLLINKQPNCIGYVMPYMAIGSLKDVIHNKEKNYDDIYTDQQKTIWIAQICHGLSHLHSNGIIHRNIKPSNILLGRSYDDVRLSDFGIARLTASVTYGLMTKVETEVYMAPEMLIGDNYTFAADIYSLAITIWEILHRRIPYKHSTDTPLRRLKKIFNGERPELNDDLSEASKFLTRCWHVDASKRPEIDEVLEFCVKTTFSLLASPAEKPNENLHSLPPVEKSSEKQTILLLGGVDGENRNSLLVLENNEQNWKELNIKLPYAIEGHGAQFLNNSLYIFGGYNEEGELNSAYKLSKSLQWEKIADMNQKRGGVSNSSVILNNQIWVCGGCDNKDKELKSVEMYDPETNKWKYMKEMNESRLYAAAAVVNGKIFCSGGEDEKKWLSSVEYYDSSSDVWTFICDMPEGIKGHGAVEIDGHFIIMGGFNGNEMLKNVWILDTADRNAKWIEKPSMSIPREDFSIAKIHHKIFVCGGSATGKTAVTSINTVEIFDGEVWRDGPMIPTDRHSFPAVAIPMSFTSSLK